MKMMLNVWNEFGSWKKKSFTHNLMSTAHIFSENEDPTHPVSDLTDDTSETWFQPESSELPVEITICLDGSYNLGYLVLKEAVCYSQRVEKFEIFVKEGGNMEQYLHRNGNWL